MTALIWDTAAWRDSDSSLVGVKWIPSWKDWAASSKKDSMSLSSLGWWISGASGWLHGSFSTPFISQWIHGWFMWPSHSSVWWFVVVFLHPSWLSRACHGGCWSPLVLGALLEPPLHFALAFAAAWCADGIFTVDYSFLRQMTILDFWDLPSSPHDGLCGSANFPLCGRLMTALWIFLDVASDSLSRCIHCGTVDAFFGYVPLDFSGLCWCGASLSWPCPPSPCTFCSECGCWGVRTLWCVGLEVRFASLSFLVHPCTCAACQVPRLDVSGLEWIKVPLLKVEVPQGSTQRFHS